MWTLYSEFSDDEKPGKLSGIRMTFEDLDDDDIGNITRPFPPEEETEALWHDLSSRVSTWHSWTDGIRGFPAPAGLEGRRASLTDEMNRHLAMLASLDETVRNSDEVRANVAYGEDPVLGGMGKGKRVAWADDVPEPEVRPLSPRSIYIADQDAKREMYEEEIRKLKGMSALEKIHYSIEEDGREFAQVAEILNTMLDRMVNGNGAIAGLATLFSQVDTAHGLLATGTAQAELLQEKVREILGAINIADAHLRMLTQLATTTTGIRSDVDSLVAWRDAAVIAQAGILGSTRPRAQSGTRPGPSSSALAAAFAGPSTLSAGQSASRPPSYSTMPDF